MLWAMVLSVRPDKKSFLARTADGEIFLGPLTYQPVGDVRCGDLVEFEPAPPNRALLVKNGKTAKLFPFMHNPQIIGYSVREDADTRPRQSEAVEAQQKSGA